MSLSLSTRLQVLLALCCLTTGHPAALVAAPVLLLLIAFRATARRSLRRFAFPHAGPATALPR